MLWSPTSFLGSYLEYYVHSLNPWWGPRSFFSFSFKSEIPISPLPWWCLRNAAEYLVKLWFSSFNVTLDFPGGWDDKESAWDVGHLFSIPGLGRSPGGGPGNPLQYSWLENPHGQRSLEVCSPWSHKESDTAEWHSSAPS